METDMPTGERRSTSSSLQLQEEYSSRMKNTLNQLNLSDDSLKAIMRDMEEVMMAGLEGGHSKEHNPLPMIPSYVRNLPTGTEEGDFIALDLGGYKCNGVVGNDVVKMLHDAFTRVRKEAKRPYKVTVAALINVPGINSHRVDAVGCLISCAYDHRNTKISIILGTGTNAAYVERLDEIGKLKTGKKKGTDKQGEQVMIVNTEWGAFGDGGCLDKIRTKFDTQMDDESINPGEQIYEKMISGMYMGELVRLITHDFIESGEIFANVASNKAREFFATKNALPTSVLSTIENRLVAVTQAYLASIVLNPNATNVFDNPDNDQNIYKEQGRAIVEDQLRLVGILHASDRDCQFFHDICAAVSRRAAYLAAAGVACLLGRINKVQSDEKIVIGADGTLIRKHPQFSRHMFHKIYSLIKNSRVRDFSMRLSEDGSGKGAAIVAATANAAAAKQ